MTLLAQLRAKFAESHLLWWLYHLLVADAVAIQRPTKFKPIYQFLGDNLGVVADVGCGPGVFTRYLSRHATRVWTADVNFGTVRRVKARQKHDTKVAFIVGEATRLPLRGSCLDTLVFLEVLEHVQDDENALKELRRVLKPGGKLVLSVPVPPGEINEDDPYGHKREGYTLAELSVLLEASGFVTERHAFAQFTFSRLGENAIRSWRQRFYLPAPIFLSWVCYLDHLFDEGERQSGRHSPAAIVVLAKKPYG